MSVTVIIPTYNRAHIIKKSIESVLNQTLSPTEVLVVDDHSTDNTQEVIESIDDKRVKYIKNFRKKGANGARNTGILKANTKFIAFQDSDDLWYPQKLEKQVKFMNSCKDCAICFSSFKLIQEDEVKIVPVNKINSEIIHSKLKTGNFISTQTILIKTSVAKDLMFDEDLMRLQDWDFVLRAANTNKIYHLEEPLVDVEAQSDSITNNVHYLDAYEQIFNKHPTLADENFYNKYIYYRIRAKNKKKENAYILPILDYGKAFVCRTLHSLI